MTLRYKTPFLLSVTKAGSVTNTPKPVILSLALAKYRRMKPTTTIRYKTSFLLSVTNFVST
jgi:hypothetical protein